MGNPKGRLELTWITHHPDTASGYDGKVATEMVGAKTGEESDRWGWNPSGTRSPRPPHGPSSH